MPNTRISKKRMWCLLCREELKSELVRPNRRWCEVCRYLCKNCEKPLPDSQKFSMTICAKCYKKGIKMKDIYPITRR